MILTFPYKAFFRRVKEGKKPGFPKFKSRKRSPLKFTLVSRIRVEYNRIRLPRIGWLRLKEHGYIPTDAYILSATISEHAGKWFVSVLTRSEEDPPPATGDPIGVDMGVKEMAIVSDGRRFDNPKPLAKYLRKLRRAQRELARRKKGSRNRNKTRKEIGRLYYRISNIRKDAIHKATSAIVARNKLPEEKPSIIGIENLNVAGMAKNRYLSRAIADVGLWEIRTQIAYKAEWSGCKVYIADRFFPSSKMCHACGSINDGLSLSDRTWTCEHCGTVLDRDLNAAINLRNIAVNTAESAGIKACGEESSGR